MFRWVLISILGYTVYQPHIASDSSSSSSITHLDPSCPRKYLPRDAIYHKKLWVAMAPIPPKEVGRAL